FHADGIQAGAQFLVNTTLESQHSAPSVAMAAGGDFVIAWQNAGQSGDSPGEYNIYARRFAADGTPRDTSDMPINTLTTDDQHGPSVAVDASGNYVIAWWSNATPAGIYARRFAADGAARDAAEWKVNTLAEPVTAPRVAMDADGDFAVIWETN